MKTVSNGYIIPFWISNDYFSNILNNNPLLINEFPRFQKEKPYINTDHSDLHIYPYIEALPAILSMGCRNTCSFCPTATAFKGKVYFGDPEIILPHYENMNVHFLDEDFFLNDMNRVLPLLRKYNIKWLAMSHFDNVALVYEKYGEDFLYDCGLRVVEVGLENISLMRKVKGNGLLNNKVEILYLNLSFLPGETKETIRETAHWMRSHNVKNPLLTYNGSWFSPGQYYFPYDKKHEDGIMLKTKYARVVPTYVPYSLLNQKMTILDYKLVNKYIHFIYSEEYQFFPKETEYMISSFIQDDYKKAMWLTVGLRVGAII